MWPAPLGAFGAAALQVRSSGAGPDRRLEHIDERLCEARAAPVECLQPPLDSTHSRFHLTRFAPSAASDSGTAFAATPRETTETVGHESSSAKQPIFPPRDPRAMQQWAVVTHELLVEPTTERAFDLRITNVTRCQSIVNYDRLFSRLYLS